ncbi:DNA recombination protein RmuC [Pseudoxanthomonas wuyuanensis]|uniref:DNA recombination protein RmuC n=1 Tax=Pseudoxanthomonas wuyuanensis TaxID=1073196 RepID=A0A286DET1_9GAMM|nr:DNA recombination protein RmuC [Pseudoxanthomonas wuyuanensis]KAF1719926.1 DNA recombination protein RmuC [Pseudoxanthomonas wuyuanensis]SOD57207.1 DNA recombination protein RmuC [Pseudoxanthomonas wuyuanensis]
MDTDSLLMILIGLSVAVLAFLLALLLRRPEARLGALLERALREEQRDGRSELRGQLDSLSQMQETRIEGFGRNLADLSTRTDQRLDLLRDALTEDARKGRLEASESQQRFADALGQRLNELTQRNELRIAELRTTLEERLKSLQADNTAKLEQMRQTVDEKLHATLETRLTESFGNVTAMLAQVHQGLGDMTKLAADVGGLQRVLTNVKSRGVFGEVQLAGLLEQVFAPDQYAGNVATVPGSNERVEFAVRFPGSSHDAAVWLPIDAKFPREDYERLIDAQEKADADAVRLAGDALERAVRKQAQEIRKYVSVPHTTEFAIMFLPTEGLYAEVLRRPGLFEAIQRDQRITIAGPTTLLALLTSLQVGFRTVAIEKRSAEVWQTLGAVKTEFAKFADVLDSVKRKLDQASGEIEKTGVRTRAIARRLRDVETLPSEDSQKLLGNAADDEAE